MLAVSHMEVRWRMIVIVHRYDDAEESADLGHGRTWRTGRATCHQSAAEDALLVALDVDLDRADVGEAVAVQAARWHRDRFDRPVVGDVQRIVSVDRRAGGETARQAQGRLAVPVGQRDRVEVYAIAE